MNFRSSRKESPSVNLTPLIDVVFLLLIFFMVSTTFERESEITINLPEASAKPQEVKEVPIDVSIDSQGRFYVNQQLLINTQLKTLKEAIYLCAGDFLFYCLGLF